MSRFRQVPEPSIIVPLSQPRPNPTARKPLTFTGAIGAACMFPLRAIINLCVALRIHPNTLTLIGVLINVGAAWALGFGRFIAGVRDHARRQHLRLHRRQGRAHPADCSREFGAFWDSTLDRFSDLALLTGLIFLYSKLGRSDYVMIAALTLIFSIMTSYARARAESLVEKCKVGFMERPERIVLFMIGAFTNRMAGVLWVILVLSILAVANRIYYTYLALNNLPMPSRDRRRRHLQPRVLLDRRARDAALRPLGDRDSRVRLADAARLARRSDGSRRRAWSRGSSRELRIRN